MLNHVPGYIIPITEFIFACLVYVHFTDFSLFFIFLLFSKYDTFVHIRIK